MRIARSVRYYKPVRNSTQSDFNGNIVFFIGTSSSPCTVVNPQNPLGSPQMPTSSPSEWTIEEVIDYIAITDPALAIHADLFRKHVSVEHHFNFMF